MSVPSYRALSGSLILNGLCEKVGIGNVQLADTFPSPNIFLSLHRIMASDKVNLSTLKQSDNLQSNIILEIKSVDAVISGETVLLLRFLCLNKKENLKAKQTP